MLAVQAGNQIIFGCIGILCFPCSNTGQYYSKQALPGLPVVLAALQMAGQHGRAQVTGTIIVRVYCQVVKVGYSLRLSVVHPFAFMANLTESDVMQNKNTMQSTSDVS